MEANDASPLNLALPPWCEDAVGRWHVVADVQSEELHELRAAQTKRPPPGPRPKGPKPLLVDGLDVVMQLLLSKLPVHRVYVPPEGLDRLKASLLDRAAWPSSFGPDGVFLVEPTALLSAGGLLGRVEAARVAFASLPAVPMPSCLAEAPASIIAAVADRSAPLRILALDGLTDALNVGALLRLAVAFEASAVLCSAECCDPFAARAIRASHGHAFNIPVLRGDLPEMLRQLREQQVLTAAAIVQENSIFLDEVQSFTRRWVFVVGSEHFGVSERCREAVELLVKIRMAPGVDSLNVSTSAGVLLHGCVEREPREA